MKDSSENWNGWYAVVIGTLIVVIVLLYFFTRYFA